MTTEETSVGTFHVNPWKERVRQREGSQLFACGTTEEQGAAGSLVCDPKHQCLRHGANLISLDVSRLFLLDTKGGQ